MLTLHTTGDAKVVLRQQQALAARVRTANRDGLLVQRTVQSAEHCGFTDSELEEAFADLAEWVQRGVKPLGEDVLADDLTSLGETFTVKPRIGSREAESMPHARERLRLTGQVSLDGRPYTGGQLFVVISRDGLVADCTYDPPLVLDGSYQMTAAPSSELVGCGDEDAVGFFALQLGGGPLIRSKESFVWPRATADLPFDATFDTRSTANMPFIGGDVFDLDGRRKGPGTLVEAYVGGALCGRSSMPAVGSRQGYTLLFPDSADRPECSVGDLARLDFKVNGRPGLRLLELGRGIDLATP